MRSLAEYIMRGRKQAALLAILFTLLPFLGWIANAIMALVTLRKGAKEGLFILLWVILPAVVVAFMGYPELWLYDVIGGTLATYLFALLLRHYASWGVVFQVGMVLGVIVVLVVHVFMPDISQVWTKGYAQYMQTVRTQSSSAFPFNAHELEKVGPALIKVATGLQVIFLLLSDFFNVAIARWAQASLYNPGGTAPEFLNIRLSVVAVAVLLLVFAASIMGIATAIDSLPVVLLPFFLAGISLCHFMLTKTKSAKIWLLIFYGLMVVLFPYFIAVLVTLALLDCWWNFRLRFIVS